MLTPPANLAKADELGILQYPSEVLRFHCQPVDLNMVEIGKLLNRMAAAMVKAGGIGLAAPQIGVPLRIFIYRKDDRFYHVINPELMVMGDPVPGEERCLSVPHLVATVRRYPMVELTGIDMDGDPMQVIEQDLYARVIQHEYDHLDGVLFIDKALPGSVRPYVSSLSQAVFV